MTFGGGAHSSTHEADTECKTFSTGHKVSMLEIMTLVTSIIPNLLPHLMLCFSLNNLPVS